MRLDTASPTYAAAAMLTSRIPACRPGRPVRGKITGELVAASDQPQPDRSVARKKGLQARGGTRRLVCDCRNSALSALNSMKALRESAFSVSRIITPAFENFRRSPRLGALDVDVARDLLIRETEFVGGAQRCWPRCQSIVHVPDETGGAPGQSQCCRCPDSPSQSASPDCARTRHWR